jgi:hypothetical protein
VPQDLLPSRIPRGRDSGVGSPPHRSVFGGWTKIVCSCFAAKNISVDARKVSCDLLLLFLLIYIFVNFTQYFDPTLKFQLFLIFPNLKESHETNPFFNQSKIHLSPLSFQWNNSELSAHYFTFLQDNFETLIEFSITDSPS